MEREKDRGREGVEREKDRGRKGRGGRGGSEGTDTASESNSVKVGHGPVNHHYAYDCRVCRNQCVNRSGR